MKKTLSILLAAVLMFALAIPAFAEDNVANGNTGIGSASQNVTASYQEGSTNSDSVDKVYLITIAWGTAEDSDLKYTVGNTTYTWNAEKTKYEATTADSTWSGSAKVTVTVTNQSNDDITATAEWTQATGITSSCTFSNNGSIDIASAAEGVPVAAGETGEAVTGTIQATVTVSDGKIESATDPIGRITVSVAPKAPVQEP